MTTIRKLIDSISSKPEVMQSALGNSISTTNSLRNLIEQCNNFPDLTIPNQLSKFHNAFDNSSIQKHIEANASLSKLVNKLIDNRSFKGTCNHCCNMVNQEISFKNDNKVCPGKEPTTKNIDHAQTRSNDLHQFLRDMYKKYKPKSPEELWVILHKIDHEEDCILQSVDSWSSRNPRIYWISSYDNEQSIGKRAFQNFFYKKLKKCIANCIDA